MARVRFLQHSTIKLHDPHMTGEAVRSHRSSALLFGHQGVAIMPDPWRVSERYRCVATRPAREWGGRSDSGGTRKIDPFAPCEIAADVAQILERPFPPDPSRNGCVECSFEFGADERIDHPP
jgi:hypothetical protein